ncbi:hypothetical protein AMS68_004941 [Peltaster fructicola]|uniref:Phospholipid/glycerol acyltransferase domain-containing protein n=1 Tax=Peltaster fructicola TaxID=286661 RepID=A0A6H0XXH0_9PEZI|nr:hypothetical protein AMS68_004941 [Peltaster fructicola]
MSGKGRRVYNNIVYDVILWVFTVVLDIFFREIHPRSSWRIPRKGPIIFVAAPHANQFVDPLILMRVVRNDAHRRISILIAAKSMKRAFIGLAAGAMGSVPVGRALDSKKEAQGRILLADKNGEQTLIEGKDVDFTSSQFMPGGTLVLPSVNGTSASAEIKEIVNATEIRLKKPFKGEVALRQLTGKLGNDDSSGKDFEGTAFNVAPHIDQSEVYEAVFKRISEGGCIGIFPEGGSHDRTELLPLKAGLAIMALGSLAEDPDCGVSIVPVGMNYFHAHKFRSRCVIEFGAPITIDPELVNKYKSDKRREAVTQVLSEVHEALKSVTLQAPDYDTLFLVQAVRRLYNPKGKRLPLPMIIELQRRFLKGFQTYKDDQRIIQMKKNVLDWHRQLRQLNIRDHQLAYARLPWWKVMAFILYRAGKLAVLSVAVIPGLILFSPVFVAGKVISYYKSKEALAASTVKIKAKDVVATWKILVSLALGPTLDIIYTIIGTYWTHVDRVGGLVPLWMPLWLVATLLLIIFPMVCFAALRFGEIGMDIFKSLRPLVLCLQPTSSNTLVKLRARRTQLQEEITQIVNELGPELFPDFDHQRIIADPSHPLSPTGSPEATTPKEKTSAGTFEALLSPRSTQHGQATNHIPQNESFQDIGKVGIFASRPTTPTDSKSKGSLQGFTALDGQKSNGSVKTDLDEVSKSLRDAMRERGRRRVSTDDDWVIENEPADPELVAKVAESDDMEPQEAKKDI